MDKKSKPSLLPIPEGLPKKMHKILVGFIEAYYQATGTLEMMKVLMPLLKKQIETPYSFAPYHQKIREPFDYYQFTLDFIRPLIDLPHSKIHSAPLLDQIDAELSRGENVILFANHQIEADPQVIAVLLEKTHPHIAEKIIYVAGERVVTDPMAVPFSMGCDLLCIYSKRYIDNPPELKAQKQLHNKNTMELMSRLLKEGGKIIYVAPSGGRDRRNADGEIEIASFDPQSIEMFYLMARKAKIPTHFYPLALDTYSILPPPETIQKDLGEARITKRCPAQIALAPEFDMEKFPGSEDNNKSSRRQARAEAIWNIVDQNYRGMT